MCAIVVLMKNYWWYYDELKSAYMNAMGLILWSTRQERKAQLNVLFSEYFIYNIFIKKMYAELFLLYIFCQAHNYL